MQPALGLFKRLYLKLVAVAVITGFILRNLLILNEQTFDTAFGTGGWIVIFAFGAVNDLLAMTLGFVFLWLFLVSLTEKKFSRPWGYLLLAALAAAWGYVTFFHTVFDEYGSVAPTIASALLGIWTGTFAFRLFFPRIRLAWTKFWLSALLFCYVGATLFNAVSEYFFWNEFGVRYNFIAVDYLIYTTEVVGNILESYPVWPLAAGIVGLSALLTWPLFRIEIAQADLLGTWRWKTVAVPAYLAAIYVSVSLLQQNARLQNDENVYINELQANGAYKLYEAFVGNTLDFRRFYPLLHDTQAQGIVHNLYGSTQDNLRTVRGRRNAPQRNVVLVTLESMSASFMERFGNPDRLTPTLDSLYGQGIAFERLFATGNRTVRGLEAVTLCLPPCPGQSLVKRTDTVAMHSTGAIFREKGYDVIYFYGGNSYFDNMETFFTRNGYRVVDEKSYAPDQITYANIWGVCDEDAYNKVLATLDETHRAGKPFFAHVMSVSNHRPFTYPAGRVRIPHDAKSRAGGVLYSDYALGQFLEKARREPWFGNTVFVITADHCASSAGRTEIPLEKYHIPAVIYAPGLIAPKRVDRLASQIDLMPTLFSLLGMEYESHFYGVDALDPATTPHAFIATYQDLGYLEGDTFTVLSPVGRSEQFRLAPTAEDPYRTVRVDRPDTALLKRTIALYQTASDWSNR